MCCEQYGRQHWEQRRPWLWRVSPGKSWGSVATCHRHKGPCPLVRHAWRARLGAPLRSVAEGRGAIRSIGREVGVYEAMPCGSVEQAASPISAKASSTFPITFGHTGGDTQTSCLRGINRAAPGRMPAARPVTLFVIGHARPGWAVKQSSIGLFPSSCVACTGYHHGDDAGTLRPETSNSTTCEVKSIAPPSVAETGQRVLSERKFVPSAANGQSHQACSRCGSSVSARRASVLRWPRTLERCPRWPVLVWLAQNRSISSVRLHPLGRAVSVAWTEMERARDRGCIPQELPNGQWYPFPAGKVANYPLFFIS